MVQNGFSQCGKIVKIGLGTVIILWGPPDDLPTPRLSRKKDSVSWERASSQNVSFSGRKKGLTSVLLEE
jgi:hypothetical protein